jgi:RNA polymerase sigma factor (sigma-70 family)
VENPAAYLRRAVVNQVRSAGRGQTSRRRRDRRWALTNPSVAETAERGIVEQLDVAGLLASLPVRQRAVVALRFLDDRSVEETAEILEVSTGTVKSQTAKAMVKLRERVEVVFDDR